MYLAFLFCLVIIYFTFFIQKESSINAWKNKYKTKEVNIQVSIAILVCCHVNIISVKFMLPNSLIILFGRTSNKFFVYVLLSLNEFHLELECQHLK